MAARRGQMTKKSKYFTAEFFGFFSDLAKNNNKEWFTKNKERYENAVQEPSLRFIRDAGPRLQKVRDRIVDEPDAWKKVIRSRVAVEGDSLKRPPPGYDPNHPLIQDLRRKDFVSSRSFRDNQVTSPQFLDSFLEVCESMDPLNRFLAGAIGLPW